MRCGWIPACVIGAFILFVPKVAAQGRGPLAGLSGGDFTPLEVQRLFDAYALVQAQEMLELSDAQYAQFLTELKALQKSAERTSSSASGSCSDSCGCRTKTRRPMTPPSATSCRLSEHPRSARPKSCGRHTTALMECSTCASASASAYSKSAWSAVNSTSCFGRAGSARVLLRDGAVQKLADDRRFSPHPWTSCRRASPVVVSPRASRRS